MTFLLVAALMFVGAQASAQCSTVIVEADGTKVVWCGPADQYLEPFLRPSGENWTPVPTIPSADWTPVPTPQGTPGPLCWQADLASSPGDELMIDSCTQPTPTPRPTYAYGQAQLNQSARLTNQELTGQGPVPMFDYPGREKQTCINWIEISVDEASTIMLWSASMTVEFPFASAGYLLKEQLNRCFPFGEIVSLQQSSETATTKINASYFER